MRRSTQLATRFLAASTTPARSFLPCTRFGLNTVHTRAFSDAAIDNDRETSRTVPTIAQAQEMPRHCSEMSNELLLRLALSGNQPAREERLTREIMAVDEIEWDEATAVMEQMKSDNKAGMGIITLPYKIGLFGSLAAGAASLPMVFSLDTALWFNQDYVTTDVPEPRDLETFLEVGSWTWGWMEPPLGTISFVLLTLQFSRNQLTNLGWKPYTSRLKASRAARLQERYPKYDKHVVGSFAVGDSWS